MSKTKENSSEMKPFVKWVGGKTQLLDLLISMVPKNFNTYYEPFVGGGALFWKISPKKAVINDINNELMNTYNVIKNNYQKLIDTLEEYREKHLQYKKDFHSQISKREREIYYWWCCPFHLFKQNLF